MTATIDPRLTALGDALQRAAHADLRTANAPRRRRRRVAVALALTAALIPGAAIAANQLLSPEEVARSLPAGTKFLVGTDPTCTTVREGVEYDCRTAVVPVGEIAPGRFKGTVEPTVDASKHVNGGCRALDADGRHWRCYIGSEAVRQKIVGAGLLGEYAPAPGQG
jgi:hypothetical protein